MKIISISGLDGSGKSTQIEMLKTYLESQGKKVFYFHAVQFSIANKHRSSVISHQSSATKSVTKAGWLKIQLRKVALFVDLLRFKKLVAKLEKEGFDYILSDRYFYDNLINIAYLEAKSCKPKVASSIPRPDFAFYLNTDPTNIMSRDRVPDQGLEYLNKKKELLEEFSKKENLIAIDGNRGKEEIFNAIKSQIQMTNVK
ncbi:MAG: hypothetical protein PHW24_01930 [Candidatus Moranbacteria bacterium]|jgi:dTMP kinase|nr:hypothetical protein [Candidatus Moranbacteria bacterium]